MGEAFLWGALAGSSLLIGALIAIVRPPHERTLGLVMAFGSGVLLSVVSFELVEKSVQVAGGLSAAALGLFSGATVFTLGDWLIARSGTKNRKDIGGEPPGGSGLSIVLGALLDGIPESAVLGLTLLQTGNIGVSMLVAVFVSNLPEGIAATSGLVNGGWSTRRITALWIAVTLACALSAGIGFIALDGASPDVLSFMFAFAAGAIITMLATSMMPEAYEHGGRAVGFVTMFGFALAFAINYLEA